MTASAAVRPRLVRRAILLEIAVILYNLLEGVIAIVAGVLAGSVALIGFGLDSAIEVSASIAVLTHLWLNRGDEALEWERRVAMFVGVTLLALAIYVGGQAIYDLITTSQPEESYLGIGIAALSHLFEVDLTDGANLGLELDYRFSHCADINRFRPHPLFVMARRATIL